MTEFSISTSQPLKILKILRDFLAFKESLFRTYFKYLKPTNTQTPVTNVMSLYTPLFISDGEQRVGIRQGSSNAHCRRPLNLLSTGKEHVPDRMFVSLSLSHLVFLVYSVSSLCLPVCLLITHSIGLQRNWGAQIHLKAKGI